MQLSTGKDKLGMIGMMKDIIAKEGVGRLYRGILPPLCMEAPKRATKCESSSVLSCLVAFQKVFGPFGPIDRIHHANGIGKWSESFD